MFMVIEKVYDLVMRYREIILFWLSILRLSLYSITRRGTIELIERIIREMVIGN